MPYTNVHFLVLFGTLWHFESENVFANSVYSTTEYTICSLITRQPPVPVAARSKAWVCGRTVAGIAGSKPTSLSLESAVCSQVEVYVGLITFPEESYGVWCVP